MKRRSFPPQPSVEHLTTLFRRIDAGDIVVPAFQRAFVWGAGEMLSLMESVNEGYPIGSLLLWSADEEILKISTSEDIPFPPLAAEMPVNYILDGLQRLSTLYGAFHYEPEVHHKSFDIHYDLTFDRFIRGDDARDLTYETVPMSSLFKPKRMLEIQRKLIEGGAYEAELDNLTALQSRFQEYMIPIVTLPQREVEEVVTIFERVNSTGTRLSRVDFMRAVTWSREFDLNEAIDDVKSSLESEGFEIDDDTIVKAMGQKFDLDPVPDSLLKLRSQNAGELRDTIPAIVSDFRHVFEFLRQELGIYSEEFVPYEGQFLALLKAFSEFGGFDIQRREFLSSWFLRLSFEEALQGRPDHHVANLVKSLIQQLYEGGRSIRSLTIDENTFVRRRMLKGKSLTSAICVMMAQSEPLDIITGERIDPFDITSAYDSNRFVPVFEVEEIEKFTGSSVSSKVPANVILSTFPFSTREQLNLRSTILGMAEHEAGREILTSHFIFDDMIEALGANDAEAFLFLRADAMLETARQMVSK